MRQLIFLILVTLSCVSFSVAQADDYGAVSFKVIQQSLFINKKNIQKVSLYKDPLGGYAINLALTPQAGKRLAKMTAHNIGRKMMVTIGNCIVNVAVIESSIGGSMQIVVGSKSAAKKIVRAMTR
ncbi:MAG: hypothetical protein KDH94_07945 [Coxiellaceae bacterium]|nr:hypothetical protein [Coxiellaceae bacterium]